MDPKIKVIEVCDDKRIKSVTIHNSQHSLRDKNKVRKAATVGGSKNKSASLRLYIGVFVIVYLCICISVFVCLCICEAVTGWKLEQALERTREQECLITGLPQSGSPARRCVTLPEYIVVF